jgi:hypothetical protein
MMPRVANSQTIGADNQVGDDAATGFVGFVAHAHHDHPIARPSSAGAYQVLAHGDIGERLVDRERVADRRDTPTTRRGGGTRPRQG